ncbi:MAG: DM13 domain-containing protein [Pseudomonadota bacterium]
MRWLVLLVTHGLVFAIGFGLGVYLLPILTAPPSVDRQVLAESAQDATYQVEFTRDLAGSDFLHWGEGSVSISNSMVVHDGALSPGPDYKLYLVPEFVEDEAGFEALKGQSLQVGDIKTFDGFIVDLPAEADIEAYNTVLVWCEAFGEFITAAKYR